MRCAFGVWLAVSACVLPNGGAQATVRLDVLVRAENTAASDTSANHPGLDTASLLAAYASAYKQRFGASDAQAFVYGGHACAPPCDVGTPAKSWFGLVRAEFDGDGGVFRGSIAAGGLGEANTSLNSTDTISPEGPLTFNVRFDFDFTATGIGAASAGGSAFDYEILADGASVFRFAGRADHTATGHSQSWEYFVDDSLVDSGSTGAGTIDIAIPLALLEPFTLEITALGSAACSLDQSAIASCSTSVSSAEGFLGLSGTFSSGLGFGYEGHPVPEPAIGQQAFFACLALAALRCARRERICAIRDGRREAGLRLGYPLRE